MEEEKKSGLLKAGIIESVIIVVLIVVIVGILSYLKVIPIGKLIPHFTIPSLKNQGNTTTVTGTKPTAVGIACPVNFQNCTDAVYTQYNNNSAALFTADKVTHNIYAVGNLLGSSTDSVALGNDRATVLKTPFILNDKCYTATYILHSSADINKITQTPYPKGTPLIRVGSSQLTAENGKKFDVLIQLQEKALDPDKSKPDTRRCTIATSNDPQASYVELSSSTFN